VRTVRFLPSPPPALDVRVSGGKTHLGADGIGRQKPSSHVHPVVPVLDGLPGLLVGVGDLQLGQRHHQGPLQPQEVERLIR
jgi:hypothetical protein